MLQICTYPSEIDFPLRILLKRKTAVAALSASAAHQVIKTNQAQRCTEKQQQVLAQGVSRVGIGMDQAVQTVSDYGCATNKTEGADNPVSHVDLPFVCFILQ